MANSTFHGVPRSDNGRFGGEPSDVAILGAPLDTGAGARPGARFGPDAIRRAPYLTGEINSLAWDTEVFKYLAIVDVGDAPVVAGSHPESIDALRTRANGVAPHTTCLVTLGGDNSITLPALEAVVARHGPVDLVHFDAHTDTWGHDTPRLTHATVVRRAVEAGLVRQGHQIGIRGFGPSREILQWGTRNGLTCWTMEDIDEIGINEVLHAVLAQVGGQVYVSVDIDVVDPAYAPGTGTPEPGGMTSRELLRSIRVLARNLNVVGCDIVEVSPPYDHADITAVLANRCLLELLAARADQLRGRDDVPGV